MGQRTWIKLYCDKWLTGTLRDDTPATRGIWADLLALAGNLNYGEDGIIKLAEGVGLSDQQIAAIFNIDIDTWLAAKGRLLQTDRISQAQDNIIHITNWSFYQSEYQRQKPFRERGKKEKGPAPKGLLED